MVKNEETCVLDDEDTRRKEVVQDVDKELKSSEISVNFDCKTTSRHIEVSDDRNMLVSYTSVVRDKLSIGNMKINFKEFVKPDTVIRVENIKYRIEGEDLKLIVKY